MSGNWGTRNSSLRHDWLRNRYLNRLSAFLDRLRIPEPDPRLLRRFLTEDFEEWAIRSVEVRSLVGSFAIEMSPSTLFMATGHLALRDHAWLCDLVDGLWRARYPVDMWTSRAYEAIEKADCAYRKLEERGAVSADSATLVGLRDEFQKFSDACERVADCLKCFPDRVLVT